MLRTAEGLGTSFGENKGHPASWYRPPHPPPGPACRWLLPPRAAHGSTYYSLRCVRRVGRQIRGTLRLPKSQGGDFKAEREASLDWCLTPASPIVCLPSA